MRKLIFLAVAFTLTAYPLGAATLNVRVETDKLAYLPGEAVNWAIHAWVDPADGTDGVALLGMDLQDDLGEVLNRVNQEEVIPGLPIYQLEGTDFGVQQEFVYQLHGVVNATDGMLVDVCAGDVMCHSHISNVGEDNGTPPLPLFCRGSYVVSTIGVHTLSVNLKGANYWTGPTVTQATGFENSALQSTKFSVIVPLAGDATGDTRIDGGDLALWQQNYDTTGDNGNTFAMGDFSGDEKIDGADLALWQQNYDPLGENPNTFGMGDFNSDGKIDGGDLALWQQNYDPLGADARFDDVTPTTVPEPMTLALVGTALLVCAALRRRGKLV